QVVPQESRSALKELQGIIQSCLSALEMSSIQVEAWDCLLVYMVSSKLPKLTLSMWEQSIHNKAEIPTWKELDSFLTERHRTLEAIDDVRPNGPVPGPSRPSHANGSSRRLNDPSLKARYEAVIRDYLDLGHRIEVPATNHVASYYLRHHAVFKPESTTTKVRVVFNASSPYANGTSLNDILHAGPVLQSDLTIQILKWRYFRYVFNADIEKMYLQIWVDLSHTSLQRILFRNPEGEIRDYELKTVTFGVNCAPFLAIRVLQQLADDEEERYPQASHIIRNYMYVDDVLAGADSKREAELAIQELDKA
ncbi:hypothetical protein KR038_002300, partial [Drosophila bunnanda]